MPPACRDGLAARGEAEILVRTGEIADRLPTPLLLPLPSSSASVGVLGCEAGGRKDGCRKQGAGSTVRRRQYTRVSCRTYRERAREREERESERARRERESEKRESEREREREREMSECRGVSGFGGGGRMG